MFIMLREQPAGADVGCSVSSALRSVDTSRRCRLFDIFRPSFSRHTSPTSAIRYLPLLVQPTYRNSVGYSVSSASCSADISHRRRLFGIFRPSFSRHIAQASAFRHSSLFFQPTYRDSVGSSVSSVSCSADTSHRRRLFGILRSSFGRHIAQASALRCSPISDTGDRLIHIKKFLQCV